MEFRLGVRLLLTATTGKAGVALMGSTIDTQAALGLTGKMPDGPMSAKALLARQEALRDVTCILIDEMGMLGAEKLAELAYICQQIRPGPGPFGGFTVVLYGDFGQLPCVKQHPLFLLPSSDATDGIRAGYELFKVSNNTHYLEHSYRHQGDPAFKEALDAVNDGPLLDGHTWPSLPPAFPTCPAAPSRRGSGVLHARSRATRTGWPPPRTT